MFSWDSFLRDLLQADDLCSTIRDEIAPLVKDTDFEQRGVNNEEDGLNFITHIEINDTRSGDVASDILTKVKMPIVTPMREDIFTKHGRSTKRQSFISTIIMRFIN